MSEPRERYSPVAAHERLTTLDALRGFALLGIALMNIEFFSRPLQGVMLGLDPALQGGDRAVAWVVAAFVQGKFWTLFSLLFGAGFAMMLERADALRADPGFAAVYARRMAALLLIGLAHAVLLWPGDILVSYALAGLLLLLLFRNLPVPQLWRVGLLLHLAPLALLWLSVLASSAAALDPEGGEDMLAEMRTAGEALRARYAAAEPVYRDGSWLEVTRQRWRDALGQYEWLPMMLPSLLGMFLLGAWFLRSGALRTPRARRRLWWLLLGLGGPLGAAAAVLAMPLLLAADMTLPSWVLAWGTTLMTAASLLLCLAYAAALVLLIDGPWPALGRLLAPLGRMALTQYLLQSLLFGTLFYGYGGGLWGEVSRVGQVGLVFAVYALQLAAAHAWFRRFRIGPVEWLWRSATYGRRPAFRA